MEAGRAAAEIRSPRANPPDCRRCGLGRQAGGSVRPRHRAHSFHPGLITYFPSGTLLRSTLFLRVRYSSLPCFLSCIAVLPPHPHGARHGFLTAAMAARFGLYVDGCLFLTSCATLLRAWSVLPVAMPCFLHASVLYCWPLLAPASSSYSYLSLNILMAGYMVCWVPAADICACMLMLLHANSEMMLAEMINLDLRNSS